MNKIISSIQVVWTEPSECMFNLSLICIVYMPRNPTPLLLPSLPPSLLPLCFHSSLQTHDIFIPTLFLLIRMGFDSAHSNALAEVDAFRLTIPSSLTSPTSSSNASSSSSSLQQSSQSLPFQCSTFDVRNDLIFAGSKVNPPLFLYLSSGLCLSMLSFLSSLLLVLSLDNRFPPVLPFYVSFLSSPVWSYQFMAWLLP